MITAKEARKMTDENFEASIKRELESIENDIKWKSQTGTSTLWLDFARKDRKFRKRIRKELKTFGYKFSDDLFGLMTEVFTISW